MGRTEKAQLETRNNQKTINNLVNNRGKKILEKKTDHKKTEKGIASKKRKNASEKRVNTTPSTTSISPRKQIVAETDSSSENSIDNKSVKFSFAEYYLFEKNLTITNSLGETFVIGYALKDKKTGVLWAFSIRESLALARKNKILDTKIRTRKINEERKAFLGHLEFADLYFEKNFLSPAIDKGNLFCKYYSDEFRQAIIYAFQIGQIQKLPKFK